MLDTNIVSQLIRGHPAVVQKVTGVPPGQLCISAVTHGELMFGLNKRPGATRLAKAVGEFLMRVKTMPWDQAAAEEYGRQRAHMEGQGITLGALDAMIAAHAIALGMTLVTNDAAFACWPELKRADWTQP